MPAYSWYLKRKMLKTSLFDLFFSTKLGSRGDKDGDMDS